jgi:hypothetical protein
VLDRCVAAEERLGRPEFEQQLGTLGRRRRLGQRAEKVSNCGLGRAAGRCAARGFAQRRDDSRIRSRGSEQ